MQVKAAECVVISLTVNVTANTIHCPGKCEYQIYNFFMKIAIDSPENSNAKISLDHQVSQCLYCIKSEDYCFAQCGNQTAIDLAQPVMIQVHWSTSMQRVMQNLVYSQILTFQNNWILFFFFYICKKNNCILVGLISATSARDLDSNNYVFYSILTNSLCTEIIDSTEKSLSKYVQRQIVHKTGIEI